MTDLEILAEIKREIAFQEARYAKELQTAPYTRCFIHGSIVALSNLRDLIKEKTSPSSLPEGDYNADQ